MNTILALVLAASVSSPIGEGVCVELSGVVPDVAMSVEGIGGYCSLSGCRLTGKLIISAAHAQTSSLVLLDDPQGLTAQQYAIFIDRTTVNRGICLAGTASNGTCLNSILVDGSTAATFSSNVKVPTLTAAASATAALSCTGTGYIQLAGVARASLPTCNAGTKGSLHYDNTNDQYLQCTDFGTGNYNWGNISPYLISGYDPITSALSNEVIKQRYYQIVRPLRIGITETVAGTGGGTFTINLTDVTGSTTLCTSSAFACTGGVGITVNSDCSAAGIASTGNGHDITLRVDATGCTTSPQGNVSAVVF